MIRISTLGNGTYHAFPGIPYSLTSTSSQYILISRDARSKWLFDAVSGRLEQILDAQEGGLSLIYDSTTQRLVRIEDLANVNRALSLTYHPDGQVASVSDGIRVVEYTYDSHGDLVRVDDVMGRPTTYVYQNHLLIRIENALGQPLERTEYEAPYVAASRAISQTLQDGRQFRFAYLEHGVTEVTITAPDGAQEVKRYRYTESGALSEVIVNQQPVQSLTRAGTLYPRTLTDGNGHTTRVSTTVNGLPLAITNALSETTQFAYDSQNRPITMTDALQRQTTWTYDGNGNLIRHTTGLTTTFPLGFTTVYTYNARYPGKNWLEEQFTPDGVVTRYDYDSSGQLTSVVVGYGTPLAQTTLYEYDSLGRVITTTLAAGTPSARQDVVRYNPDNSIQQTIQNYVDGVFDAAQPREDVITTYGYDVLGRQIWVRDALGRYDVTHYDANGHVNWTTQNMSGFGGELTLPAQPPAYSPQQPDANVTTFYAYDGLGRTSLITQTGRLGGSFDPATRTFSTALSHVTRIEYDAWSRPITVTLNYQDGVFDPARPDEDVQTLTSYDAVGNVTWQRDALGRWTHTQYDPLNRPRWYVEGGAKWEPDILYLRLRQTQVGG